MKTTNNDENLEEKGLFLQSIVDNVPNMIFVKEAKELRFVLFNKAGEELLGYLKEYMIGKNDYDFFPKDQASFFIEKDKQVLKSKQMLDIPEEPIQTRTKGERILHTKKIPILDENGEPKYLLGISEDVTERVRAETMLQEKIKELEKLNKIMVNRELKMAELKKQINENKN